MRAYRYQKMGVIFITCGIFFAIRAFFWFKDVFEENTVPEKDLFMFALYDDGYFGVLEQVLLGTIILVIAVEYVLKSNNTVLLIRHNDRQSYLNVQIRDVIWTCMGVTLCKFLIVFFALLIRFDTGLVFSSFSIVRFVSSIVMFSIYAIRCGIIYMIIRDLIDKKALAMGLTTFVYFLIFYIWLDNVLGFIVPIKWVPCLDLSSSFDLCIGEISILEFLLIAVRQVVMTIGCIIVWDRIWRRKDVLDLEK